MRNRAMIVVAAGSSARFGVDKLTALVAGEPLLAHTLRAVSGTVDRVIVVCHPDQMDVIGELAAGCDLVVGGPSRTESEIAGLRLLGDSPPRLIGIHDGARPAVPLALVERLFAVAAEVGGAIPVVSPPKPIVDVTSRRFVTDLALAQTPQVFRGPELVEAYERAAADGFRGHDTAETMARYADLEIAAVSGDPANLKVTRPEDLDQVAGILERSRS